MKAIKMYEQLSKLIAERFSRDDAMADTLMTTLSKITELVINNGFVVKFKIKEDYAKVIGLTTDVLELKTGNNGGFSYAAENKNSGIVVMHVSVAATHVTLAVPFKELIGIYVFKEDLMVTEIRDLVLMANNEKYTSLINHAELSIPEGSNVVSMNAFKKKGL